MGSDHYVILGVPYNASSEEIRNAYFLLARQLHPDVNPSPETREQFLTVQRAYEVLSNPKKKSEYDVALTGDLRTGPEISMNARYSHSAILNLQEPQLAYVLVDMYCIAEMMADRLPACHICLVLDRSTSMQGGRMDMVKQSALNLIQQLRAMDMLSVVSFADHAEVVIPPTRASSLSRSDSRINLLQTGGGTEIFQGLSLGIAQLRRGDSGMARQLILLTDGNTYGDEDDCFRLASEAASEGISISVLGIGHEWNDEFMDQLVGLGGGNTTFVSSPRDLDQFIQHKLRALESIYARNLRYEFETGPDVQLRYAYRISPDNGPLPVSNSLLLGDVHYNKSISILFEFLVPPIPSGLDRVTLARGTLHMELPAKKEKKARLLLDMYRMVGEIPSTEAPPAVIVEALSRLTLYRMQEKVRNEVNDGNIETATRRLQHLATHLLSQGDRELAHTVLMEAEHIKQKRQYSKDGDKRIKYGTRALLLPAGLEHKL